MEKSRRSRWFVLVRESMYINTATKSNDVPSFSKLQGFSETEKSRRSRRVEMEKSRRSRRDVLVRELMYIHTATKLMDVPSLFFLISKN